MIYWNAINKIQEIGPKRFKLLYDYFTDLRFAWKAGKIELIKSGLNENIALKFIKSRKKINPQKEFEKIKKNKIEIINIFDDKYPKILKKIQDPPPILYYKGRLPKNNEINLGIIGSRKYSSYGKKCCLKLTKDLALNGINILSGLALGIDTIAHETALKYKAPTFAVLGCGLDQIYPYSNYNLAQKIINSNGGIICEYPPGYPNLKQNFYARNRIISGISHAILVIQAYEKSGTFITVNHARVQKRKIFAVPGNITCSSNIGTNKLIQDQAKLVIKAKDILQELKIPIIKKFIKEKNKIFNQINNFNKKNLTKDQLALLDLINIKGFSLDQLVKTSKLDSNIILANLTELEMLNLIQKEKNKYFRK
jgi:DNA processing protein